MQGEIGSTMMTIPWIWVQNLIYNWAPDVIFSASLEILIAYPLQLNRIYSGILVNYNSFINMLRMKERTHGSNSLPPFIVRTEIHFLFVVFSHQISESQIYCSREITICSYAARSISTILISMENNNRYRLESSKKQTKLNEADRKILQKFMCLCLWYDELVGFTCSSVFGVCLSGIVGEHLTDAMIRNFV